MSLQGSCGESKYFISEVNGMGDLGGAKREKVRLSQSERTKQDLLCGVGGWGIMRPEGGV